MLRPSCGCTWLYTAVYGCIWLYMAVMGCIWAGYGCIWLYVVVFSCIWLPPAATDTPPRMRPSGSAIFSRAGRAHGTSPGCPNQWEAARFTPKRREGYHLGSKSAVLLQFHCKSAANQLQISATQLQISANQLHISANRLQNIANRLQIRHLGSNSGATQG
jgi:hypothetical protein